MVGNLRAAGLTGPAYKDSIVIAQQDVRGLTPEYIERLLPAVRDMKPGVFCFNPPYGVRIGAEHGDEQLLALYSDMGRAFARFSGWRAACFVANPNFVEAFAHAPIMTKPASNADLRGAFLRVPAVIRRRRVDIVGAGDRHLVRGPSAAPPLADRLCVRFDPESAENVAPDYTKRNGRRKRSIHCFSRLGCRRAAVPPVQNAIT